MSYLALTVSFKYLSWRSTAIMKYYVNSYSAGIDFRRQNLTSVGVRCTQVGDNLALCCEIVYFYFFVLNEEKNLFIEKKKRHLLNWLIRIAGHLPQISLSISFGLKVALNRR